MNNKRTIGRALLLGLLLSAGPNVASAKFDRLELSVPGSILSATYGDLDGDGLIDLVVAFRRGYGPKAERFLSVFFRSESGFGQKPDLNIPAPADAAVYDLGDALPGGGDELLYLTSIGVYAQSLAGRKPAAPARIITVPTVVGAPEDDDFLAWDFCKSAPSRPPTITLPTRRALEIHRREGDVWKRWAAPKLDQASYYDAESATYRRSGRGGSTGRPFALRVTTVVPNLDLVDQNGDGRLDLVTNYEDRIAVYLGGEDGSLSEKSSWYRWFSIRSKEEVESRDAGVSADLADFDGDGIVDLALTKIGGGVTTLKTAVMLYRGQKSGGFEDQPCQTFEDEGFAALARFEDLDADGKVEMLHPHSEVSIMALSRAMLSSKIGLEIRIRRRAAGAGKTGPVFEPKPVQVLETNFGLDLSVGATLRGTAPLYGWDFDADGRLDVILSESGDEMTLHRGLAPGSGALFEDEGRITLSASGTNTTQILPVRSTPGQGPDVLVYYVARRDLAGRVYVFLNRYGPNGANKGGNP